MKRMVCGFMFSEAFQWVVLIRKTRPEWQNGLLNGVGGHIEYGETIGLAMAREFAEETGVSTHPEEWIPFYTLSGENWIVYFLACVGCVDLAKTTTDETVCIVSTSEITPFNKALIPNLRWLIPMGIDAIQSKPLIEPTKGGLVE